VRYFDVCA